MPTEEYHPARSHQGVPQGVLALARMSPLKVLATTLAAALVVWGLLFVYLSSPAWAAEITVNTTADTLDTSDPTGGNSDGLCSLREAITAANTETAVDECAAGTGEDTIVFDLGSSATITLGSKLPPITDADGLTIDGGSAAITVDGNNAVRSGFEVSSGAALTVSNLTIARGFDPLSGGAIANFGELEITNSTLSGNSAADSGGAIYNEAGAALEVSNSTLSGNSAGSGIGQGGGIDNFGGLEITNSTLSGNSAPNIGGAIFSAPSGSLTVSNSTFSGNSAGSAGGSLFNVDGATPAQLRNTIVASSPGGNCAGPITDGGYNLDDGTTCGFSTANNSQPSTNPLLGPLADNGGPTQTHALLTGSPAIDKGNSFGATTDQRGESRPHDFASIPNVPGGDGSDIGSFELEEEAENQAPSVTVDGGGSCGAASDMRGTINLALIDPDDPAESLTLRATSSNRSVLPNRNISFGGGTDASRTMTVSSLSGSGTSNVTITLSDGDLEGTVVVRVISGSAANNTLTGSTNSDMIFARKGRDTLSAQGANDLMCAGNGNDRLTGGAGADHFGGGSGTDTATDFDDAQGDTRGGIP